MSQEASKGAESVLQEVFLEQRGRLWGYLMRGAGSPDIAEDLLQETFLRAWDSREALAGDPGGADPEGARRYLWRVARNLLIDEIRMRQRRRSTVAGPPRDAVDPSPDHGESLEWQEGIRIVREMAARIRNPQGRRCLQLWIEGALPGEIARATGLAPGRVRGLVQRARAEVVLKAIDRFRVRGG